MYTWTFPCSSCIWTSYFYRSVNASLPQKTRNNGSLFAHLFIYPVGESPFNSEYASHAVAPLTVYSLPQDESINLLNSGEMPKKVRILVRHPGLCRRGALLYFGLNEYIMCYFKQGVAFVALSLQFTWCTLQFSFFLVLNRVSF